MSLQDTIAVAPGWYPDPAGSARLRWWSGVGWTDHLAGELEAPEVLADHEPARAERSSERTSDSATDVLVMAATTPSAQQQHREVPAEPADTPDEGAVRATSSVDAWWIPAAPVEAGADEPPTGRPSSPTPSVASWRTAPSWWLAFLTPIVMATSLVVLVATFSQPLVYALLSLAVGAGWLAALILLTLKDRAALARLGMTELPSAWWLLFGPLFYLGARGFAVRAAGGRGWATLWAGIAAQAASVLAVFGVTFALAASMDLTALAAANAGQTTSALEEEIQSQLAARGLAWEVECPAEVDFAVGSTFTCAVVSGEASEIAVTVGEDGGLAFRAE